MTRLLTGGEGGVCFAQCSGNWECTSGESFGEAGDLEALSFTWECIATNVLQHGLPDVVKSLL